MTGKLNHVLTTAGYLAVLYLTMAPGGAALQTHSHTDTTTSGHVSSSQAPQRCREQASCQVVAVAIGSLVAGFILGILVTYLVGLFLKKRKHRLPPKDYDVTEDTHCDVNRNSDDPDQYRLQGQVTPGVKGHKKLERLVQQSATSPGDPDLPSAAAPLILDGLQDTVIVPRSSAGNKSDASGLSTDIIVYANVGAEAQLSQPYETLDIVLEESEYCIPRTSSSDVGVIHKQAAK